MAQPAAATPARVAPAARRGGTRAGSGPPAWPSAPRRASSARARAGTPAWRARSRSAPGCERRWPTGRHCPTAPARAPRPARRRPSGAPSRCRAPAAAPIRAAGPGSRPAPTVAGCRPRCCRSSRSRRPPGRRASPRCWSAVPARAAVWARRRCPAPGRAAGCRRSGRFGWCRRRAAGARRDCRGTGSRRSRPAGSSGAGWRARPLGAVRTAGRSPGWPRCAGPARARS